MKNKISLSALALLSLILVVSSCKPSAPTKTSFPQVGSLAPDFETTLRLPNGATHTFRLANQKGKIVWLNFFATWCPMCLEEMPDIQKVWDGLQKGEIALDKEIVLVVISVAEDPERVIQFLNQHNYRMPFAFDRSGEIAGKYQIIVFPTHFFIDKQGIIRQIHRGVLNRSQIVEILKSF